MKFLKSHIIKLSDQPALISILLLILCEKSNTLSGISKEVLYFENIMYDFVVIHYTIKSGGSNAHQWRPWLYQPDRPQRWRPRLRWNRRAARWTLPQPPLPPLPHRAWERRRRRPAQTPLLAPQRFSGRSQGKQSRLVGEDMLARVFQHEIDHLEGILFLDRMDHFHRNLLRIRYLKRMKKKKR